MPLPQILSRTPVESIHDAISLMEALDAALPDHDG
jgi:hypothetical protein